MLSKNQPRIGSYHLSVYAIEHIKREPHNPNYLSSAEFRPEQLILTNDIFEVVNFADIIKFAVPSAFEGGELKKLTVSLERKIIFSAIKGIMPESGKLVGAHFNDVYHIPFKNIRVIAGPCQAEEVALERLCYLTITNAADDTAQLVANILSCAYIKCTRFRQSR